MEKKPLTALYALILTAALTGFVIPGTVHADASVALTREAQAKITPAKALAMLKQGNERFVSGKAVKRDFLAQVKQTSEGQLLFGAMVAAGSALAEKGDGIIDPGEDETAELARAVQNPVASLISVPFQNNTNFDFGPREKTQNVLNIQPVIPFSLNEN